MVEGVERMQRLKESGSGEMRRAILHCRHTRSLRFAASALLV